MARRGRASWYPRHSLPDWDEAGGRAPRGRSVGAVSDDVTRGLDNAGGSVADGINGGR